MDAPSEAQPKQTPGLLPTLAVAGVALAAGLGAGLFLLGPRLGGGAHAAAAPTRAAPGTAKKGEPATSQLFTIDGLIVNPAGSRGQHHLIITVAFEVQNPEIHARLRAAEVPLRDALSGLLERRTLEELTAPGVRDRLRNDLAPLVAPYVEGTPVRVYVPQFIVQ